MFLNLEHAYNMQITKSCEKFYSHEILESKIAGLIMAVLL